PGQAERDIPETRRLAYEAISETLTTAAVDPGEIAAVAPTGHGKGVYTLHRDRSPGIGIVSTDTRSASIGAQMMAEPDYDEVFYAKTFQPLWPGHTAPILAWLKRNRREEYDAIGSIQLAKDLIRFFLTDAIHVEVTDISGTGFWDNTADTVDQAILDRLGIPEIAQTIPPVVHSHDIAGSVTEEAARLTGLKEGTPVVGGLFDVNACTLATGVQRPDELAGVVGTWSISAFVTPDFSRAAAHADRYVIQAHSMPGMYLIHEASPTSAGNLEWFTANLLPEIPEEQRFDYCNEAVAATPETSVSFFPYLFGSDLGADASGTVLGLRAGTTREEIIRAVYEGVVFQHVRHMNRLLAISDHPDEIRFAGGATRSGVWMQMFADALGIPVTVSTAEELGALGAAICAAVGVGVYASYHEAMAAMTGVRETYRPDPAAGAALREKQTRFEELVDALQPAWRHHG
ncbi:MAG TPA: FGGY-family carbohydrate kinase, partial [Alkalispirochaeta sp.]|nr:FGGY-family carbohydrate kinase [Alkalispirochaeta sp.]